LNLVNYALPSSAGRIGCRKRAQAMPSAPHEPAAGEDEAHDGNCGISF
jgi:hypothetical protein